MTELSQSEKRSRNMAAIRSKDTKPELAIRRALHAAGFRYSLHNKSLPGTPDLVLQKHRTVVFVHGCFWHVHCCRYFRWPESRAEFWKEKLNRNLERDTGSIAELLKSGWRVAVIWECALRSGTWTAESISQSFADWLKTDQPLLTVEDGRLQEPAI